MYRHVGRRLGGGDGAGGADVRVRGSAGNLLFVGAEEDVESDDVIGGIAVEGGAACVGVDDVTGSVSMEPVVVAVWKRRPTVGLEVTRPDGFTIFSLGSSSCRAH
jgi:hypothetical protein